jgi:putative lipoprotein
MIARAAIALAVVAAPRIACADDWLGPDKALHFSVSAGLAVGGYATGSIWLERRWVRATAGASFAFSAGVAKEAWDATGRGDPSAKDLAWDAIGTAVGVGLALLVDELVAR